MKLILKSALVLMLGILILASAASASYVATVGGATSGSTSGGATSGTTTLGARTLTGISYNDVLAGTNQLNGPLWGSTTLGTTVFQHILTESIGATASVASGETGEASASFTTDGEQKVTQALPVATFPLGGYLSTSIDGSVAVSASKTTTQGVATSTAVMEAQSAATPITGTIALGTEAGALGGTAQLFATASQSGIGTVLAEAKGDTSHESNIGVGDLSYSFGHANGDAKISGSNSVLDGLTAGGSIAGTANIYAGTDIVEVGSGVPLGPAVIRGQSITTETITLNANRGISFEGDSTIEALLNGDEAGETSYATAVANTPTIVDNEAVSVMDAKARALHKHDRADVALIFKAETGTDSLNAMANSLTTGTARVTRDSDGSSTEKAQAEGFITNAVWKASTQLPIVAPATVAEYASIQGKTGNIDLTDSTGLGVGAWILTPYINPMISSAAQIQSAATGVIVANPALALTGVPAGYTPGTSALAAAALPAARGNLQTYDMRLEGMTPSTHTNDAVGAYLGIGVQYLRNILPVPVSQTTTQTARNGINWLEGANSDPLPGHYSTNVIPTWITVVTPVRTSGLTGI